jgi:diacylglycerol kinase family enzyme
MPAARQRDAAIGGIGLVAFFVVLTVISTADDLRRSTIGVPLLAVAIAAAWYAVTRGGTRRRIALAVCVVAVIGVLATGLIGGLGPALLALIRLLLLLVAALLARTALGRDIRTLKAAPVPGDPVPAAERGALIINPRSGDGKAERVGLADACRERGIEPIVLVEGTDLRQLAMDALDAGADVIGMAGGDGSQALVASIAAERDVPMVVVPAGTRNHLAMDLGLDRDDVVGALDAFGEAVERPVDLGDVNGRVFVNNVSLGLYATIVRSPEYRDAKVDTTIATLQQALSRETPAFDLRFTDPEGTPHERAHLIQISNGAYGDTFEGLTSRPRLDSHELEIITLEIADGRAAAALVAAFAARHPERFEGFRSWRSRTFEVTSGGPIDVGLDGEALTLDPPLRFSIRDRPVRVRSPRHAIGYSPARRSLSWRAAIRGVFQTAAGRPVPIDPSPNTGD